MSWKRFDRVKMSEKFFAQLPSCGRPRDREGTVMLVSPKGTMVYVRWDGLNSVRGECTKWITGVRGTPGREKP
jgi:hypothetical protein